VADTVLVDEVMDWFGVGVEIKVGELENSGLPFQKPPHENIREKPGSSDTRLAKNQDDLPPIRYIPQILDMLQSVFLRFKKNSVHLPVGFTDEQLTGPAW